MAESPYQKVESFIKILGTLTKVFFAQLETWRSGWEEGRRNDGATMLKNISKTQLAFAITRAENLNVVFDAQDAQAFVTDLTELRTDLLATTNPMQARTVFDAKMKTIFQDLDTLLDTPILLEPAEKTALKGLSKEALVGK